MKNYSKAEIDELEHLFKINLINSCSGYKSANLIGTISENGLTNVAIFSSVIHMGSAPPLLGFILRPNTVPRNTYENIKNTGIYTINHIHDTIIAEAHHTSAKYDAAISEFDMTSLQQVYKKDFRAPFVKGSPIQTAMKFKEEYPIKSNGTILIIGEIQDVYFNENLLEEDGFLNLSKGKVAAINGLDGYAIPTLKERQSYQRPKKSSP